MPLLLDEYWYTQKTNTILRTTPILSTKYHANHATLQISVKQVIWLISDCPSTKLMLQKGQKNKHRKANKTNLLLHSMHLGTIIGCSKNPTRQIWPWRWATSESVTGNETWIHYFESPIKELNKVWLHKVERDPLFPEENRVQRRFFT